MSVRRRRIYQQRSYAAIFLLILLFPLPFGPVTHVNPSQNSITVVLVNDLNPTILSLVSRRPAVIEERAEAWLLGRSDDGW